MNHRRGVLSVMLLVLALGAMLILPSQVEACIVNVTCPWYVTPVYHWGEELLFLGYTPLQMLQIGTENVEWIAQTLGITPDEAAYAVIEVYSILKDDPRFLPPVPVVPGEGGGYGGDGET